MELAQFAKDRGFDPRPCDGQFYRFERSGDMTGWWKGTVYMLGDKPVTQVNFGDWRTDEKYEWTSGTTNLSSEEAGLLAVELKKAQAAERAARAEEQERVALECQRIWDHDLVHLGESPYFRAKGLPHHLFGCRLRPVAEGLLTVAPLRDGQGKLWGLQYIHPTGKPKNFSSGARIKGSFHVIGELPTTGGAVIYVCEGVATGASIATACPGTAVACAFNAGNLLAVAQSLRSHHPSARIVVCGDDDRWTRRPNGEPWNTGRERAMAAAQAVGGEVCFPTFGSLDGNPTDFNDLHVREGLTPVSAQLRAPLPPTPVTPAKKEKKSKADIEQRLCDAILEKVGPNLIKWKRDLFEYSEREGIWYHLDPDAAIDKYYKLLNVMSQGTLCHRDLVATYNRLLMLLPQAPREPFIPDRYCVGFQNGALHLVPGSGGRWTTELRGHARENFLIHAHPYDYDPNAEPNAEFDAAVGRVLGGDATSIQAYYQVLGACLLPGAFRKLVFFVGRPKSGKSTLILFAWHLVDKRFRCAVDPTQMHGFNTESMAGKLLNADPDIKLSKPLTDDILKKVEDGFEMRVQRKNKADLYASIPGMHLFGGNGMPKTADGVEPYQRRMIIFPCDSYKAPDGHNKQYVSEVWANNGPGILRRAIEGMLQLCQSGGHFTAPPRATERMAEWKSDNADLVEEFVSSVREGDFTIVDKNTVVSLDSTGRVTRGQVWDLFCAWAEKCALRRVLPTPNQLYKRLRELGIEDQKSDGVRYFRGLKVEIGQNADY